MYIFEAEIWSVEMCELRRATIYVDICGLSCEDVGCDNLDVYAFKIAVERAYSECGEHENVDAVRMIAD